MNGGFSVGVFECLSVATRAVVLALTSGETITRQVAHLIRARAAEWWELVIRGSWLFVELLQAPLTEPVEGRKKKKKIPEI